MTKASLIAIISVWHCVAYGQLSVHNIPYYIPYVSAFVSQPNHQNYDGTVDQLGGNAGELFERNSPFQGAMFVKMKKLEAATASLAKQLKDVKDILKATKDDLAKKADQSDLVKTNAELQTTSNNLETATINLASTKTELSSTKSAVEDLTKMLNARTSEIVDIGQMPTSCADLQRMGHKLSGFFSVKGSEKMEMIYCNLNPNQNDKQKWIGYADVKSAPVHFYVQRKSSFTTAGIITFDLPVVNEGNAMDLTSGIFTAPRQGIYFFSFTGHANFETLAYLQLLVGIYLNGSRIGTSYVFKGVDVDVLTLPLTVQSTLNLKKGDRVWVAIFYQSQAGVYLLDSSVNHLTHFTGFLLEEEIVASL